MTATALLAKLHDHGITVHADGDQLRLDAPTGTLTPELLSAVKSYKQDLLEILTPDSLLPDGLGGSGSLIEIVCCPMSGVLCDGFHLSNSGTPASPSPQERAK